MCRCPVRPPIFPRPPPGCTIFSPPDRGALVCLLLGNGNRIYCSVVCDNQSEFSDFPLNPYTCGDHTQFRWVNFFDITQDTLPQCSGKSRMKRSSPPPPLEPPMLIIVWSYVQKTSLKSLCRFPIWSNAVICKLFRFPSLREASTSARILFPQCMQKFILRSCRESESGFLSSSRILFI